MPEMVYVQSSNVESVGYDVNTAELHVRYVSFATIYVYQGVPADVFDRLMIAPSKGVFISQEVKGAFPFYKL